MVYAHDKAPAIPCNSCDATGLLPTAHQSHNTECGECNGMGYLGVDPDGPTICAPGTREKVSVMARRYEAGLPLHHPLDADHGGDSSGEFEYAGAQDDDENANGLWGEDE